MKKLSYFFFLCIGLLFSRLGARGQLITTFAGNGSGIFAGDGGMATDASVYVPGYIAAAPDGGILVADYGNNRIRKIDETGIITTIAGTGVAGYTGNDSAATLAAMFRPTGIVTDAAGNIYFTDNGNYAVRKISLAGIITTVAGTGVSGYSGDGGPATAAQLTAPEGLGIDAFGNLYVPDGGAHCIRKVSVSGIITTIVGTGAPGYSGDGGAATAAQLNKPVDVAVDSAGNIYCTDQNNNVIRKIDRTGVITTIAGTGVMGYWGDNGPATAALLNRPAGVFADDSGRIYFADFFNNSVRKIDAGGTITTVAGVGVGGYAGDGGAATAARLRLPNKLIVDNCGDYLIADRSNHRIRKVSFPDARPLFINAAHDTLHTCMQEAVSLAAQLVAFNAYKCQTLSWAVSGAPAHGALSGFPYSIRSTGDTVAPAACWYTPGIGFVGVDSFRMLFSDGGDTVYKTIYVQVHPLPAIAPILGPDSLCAGDTGAFSSATTGGTWSLVTGIAGTVDTTGIFTALASGVDTIVYRVADAWCVASVRKVVRVSVPEVCVNKIVAHSAADFSISAIPNPTVRTTLLKINTPYNIPVQIVVTDAMGREVLVMKSWSNQSIELTLPPVAGVYQVRAAGAAGAAAVRIVKLP